MQRCGRRRAAPRPSQAPGPPQALPRPVPRPAPSPLPWPALPWPGRPRVSVALSVPSACPQRAPGLSCARRARQHTESPADGPSPPSPRRPAPGAPSAAASLLQRPPAPSSLCNRPPAPPPAAAGCVNRATPAGLLRAHVVAPLRRPSSCPFCPFARSRVVYSSTSSSPRSFALRVLVRCRSSCPSPATHTLFRPSFLRLHPSLPLRRSVPLLPSPVGSVAVLALDAFGPRACGTRQGAWDDGSPSERPSTRKRARIEKPVPILALPYFWPCDGVVSFPRSSERWSRSCAFLPPRPYRRGLVAAWSRLVRFSLCYRRRLDQFLTFHLSPSPSTFN